MLIDIYDYAIDKREEILKRIDIRLTEEKIREAKSIWNRFDDEYHDVSLAGIDSRWNLIPYHGFYLYAVDAVSIKSDESIISKKHQLDIGTLEFVENDRTIYNPGIRLESKGMVFEYELIKESIGASDLILVDGSLQARIYNSRERRMTGFYDYAKSILKKDDIIFIAKRSESRSMLKGYAGDIYYFDNANSESGYSDPYHDDNITIVYARFADDTPCVRVEFGMKIDKDIVKDRLSSIKEQCVAGYPYVLSLAHEMCKISNKEMRNIESLLGLETEIGGREVMEY